MSGVSNGYQDVDIDLAELFRAVWRRKTIVLGATAAVAALAFVGANMIAPNYQSEAKLLIESRDPRYSAQGNNATAPGSQVFDELDIASQVELLRSTDLIRQVARDLKLYELEEFDPDTHPSVITDLLVLLHLKKSPLDMAPEDRVLKAFREKLQVYSVEKSRVIGIQFTSEDPKLASAIPNRMAQVYLSLQSGAKLDTNSEAARWLEPEIANLREKVRDAEKKVADYRASQGLFATSDSANFATKQLNDISTELARVRGEKADADAKAKTVRAAVKAGRAPETLDAVAASPVVQNLKETEANLGRQLSQLSTSLLDGHPQIKALRAQLGSVRDQIRAEALKIAAGFEDTAEVAKLRETQLIQQLNVLKSDSARANEDEVGLKALEREAAAQRQLLETYLSRYREATTRLDKDATPADARVVSTATEPREPHFPKVGPITLVAALAAFVLSAMLIMVLELFSGRALRPSRPAIEPVFTAPEEEPAARVVVVEEGRTVVPVLEPSEPEPAKRRARGGLMRRLFPAGLFKDETVVVPAEPVVAEAAPPRVAAASEASQHMVEAVAAETATLPQDEVQAVDAVDDGNEFSIAAVASYLETARVPVALVLSPSGDDGSTATVLLARHMGERGRHVVLIDMTASACPTRLMARGRNLKGIADLLRDEAAFVDAIHRDRLSDAHVIPRGQLEIEADADDLDALGEIAEMLSEAYDLVLIECGDAEPQDVARISRGGTHEIVLSAPQPDREALAAVMAAFETVGYADLVLMSDPVALGEGRPRRRAA